MMNNTIDALISARHPKHIAFIGQKGIPAEFPGTSGVEFYVEHRASELVQLGSHASCYVRSWATPPNIKIYKQIKLIHVPTVNTKHLDATVHSLLSSLHVCFTSADTVWYQASGPAIFSFIPKLFGKKIVVTIHALDWQRAKWGVIAKAFIRLGEWVGCMAADDIITVSPALSEYILRTYRRPSVIDPPIIKKKPRPNPSIITQKYGLKGNDFILYVGRFVPEKRLEWLINAYNHLNPTPVGLVIAGGPTNSREYEIMLRSLAQNNRNILFPGWMFNQEKVELLENCLAFVLPSSLEGYPYVISELSKKKPLLVSDAVAKGISRKHLTYTFKEESYEDFKNKLLQILSKHAATPGVGVVGRTRV
jgi:glycosyltransferase involved in cell wall biosynthesis